MIVQFRQEMKFVMVPQNGIKFALYLIFCANICRQRFSNIVYVCFHGYTIFQVVYPISRHILCNIHPTWICTVQWYVFICIVSFRKNILLSIQILISIYGHFAEPIHLSNQWSGVLAFEWSFIGNISRVQLILHNIG